MKNTLDKIYNILTKDIWLFIKNIWLFKKELWEYRWYDSHFILMFIYKCIYDMEKKMHKGLEVKITRNKKINKMNRSLYLLKNKIEDRYIELAENELGIKYNYDTLSFEKKDNTDKYYLVSKGSKLDEENNLRLIKKSREIEEEQWKELWEIFKGTDKSLNIDITDSDSWEKNFDGTDIRGWWD